MLPALIKVTRSGSSDSRISASAAKSRLSATTSNKPKIPRHPVSPTSWPPISGASTGAMPMTSISSDSARAAPCVS